MEGAGRQKSVLKATDVLVGIEGTSLRDIIIFMTQHRASEDEIVSLRGGSLRRSYAGANTSLISDVPGVTVCKMRSKYDSKIPFAGQALS